MRGRRSHGGPRPAHAKPPRRFMQPGRSRLLRSDAAPPPRSRRRRRAAPRALRDVPRSRSLTAWRGLHTLARSHRRPSGPPQRSPMRLSGPVALAVAALVVSACSPKSPDAPKLPQPTILTLTTAEGPSPECLVGGVRIDAGVDDGTPGGTARNGILDPQEIDTTVRICGAAEALVKVTPEPAGVRCAAGGSRVDAGVDDGTGGGTPGNGVLETGEIDRTTYVCNGLSATCVPSPGAPALDLAVEVSTPSNGQFFASGERPVLSIRFLDPCGGTASLGSVSLANLYLTGPRARRDRDQDGGEPPELRHRPRRARPAAPLHRPAGPTLRGPRPGEPRRRSRRPRHLRAGPGDDGAARHVHRGGLGEDRGRRRAALPARRPPDRDGDRRGGRLRRDGGRLDLRALSPRPRLGPAPDDARAAQQLRGAGQPGARRRSHRRLRRVPQRRRVQPEPHRPEGARGPPGRAPGRARRGPCRLRARGGHDAPGVRQRPVPHRARRREGLRRVPLGRSLGDRAVAPRLRDLPRQRPLRLGDARPAPRRPDLPSLHRRPRLRHDHVRRLSDLQRRDGPLRASDPPRADRRLCLRRLPHRGRHRIVAGSRPPRDHRADADPRPCHPGARALGRHRPRRRVPGGRRADPRLRARGARDDGPRPQDELRAIPRRSSSPGRRRRRSGSWDRSSSSPPGRSRTTARRRGTATWRPPPSPRPRSLRSTSTRPRIRW